MIARRIRVSGKVQGVWFRNWTIQTAKALGVRGWVRNRQDESVEVYAAGEPEAVERLIERLHDGSPASRVDRVDVREAAVEATAGFMRLPTR